jgi:hypothetical protein
MLPANVNLPSLGESMNFMEPTNVVVVENP